MYALLGSLSDKGWEINIDTESASAEMRAFIDYIHGVTDGMSDDQQIGVDVDTSRITDKAGLIPGGGTADEVV